MADAHQVDLISKGIDTWNGWRNLSDIKPDLSEIDLSKTSQEFELLALKRALQLK